MVLEIVFESVGRENSARELKGHTVGNGAFLGHWFQQLGRAC